MDFNDIKLFDFFGENILIACFGDNKWWCSAFEIAKGLGYKQPKEAVLTYCRDISEYTIPLIEITINATGEVVRDTITFINENAVRKLITHSPLPQVKEVEKYFFNEVIPMFMSLPNVHTDIKVISEDTYNVVWN
jgi:prophage antirepressor-like protein